LAVLGAGGVAVVGSLVGRRLRGAEAQEWKRRIATEFVG